MLILPGFKNLNDLRLGVCNDFLCQIIVTGDGVHIIDHDIAVLAQQHLCDNITFLFSLAPSVNIVDRKDISVLGGRIRLRKIVRDLRPVTRDILPGSNRPEASKERRGH